MHMYQHPRPMGQHPMDVHYHPPANPRPLNTHGMEYSPYPPYQGGYPANMPMQGFSGNPMTGGGQIPNPSYKGPFISAFITPDGKFDFAKTFQTVDQVVKTVNQVSPIVKQVSSFFTSGGKA